MKPISLTACLLLALCSCLRAEAFALPDNYVLAFNEDQERYIAEYKDIAIREMERQGVPASIKLAQGILESDAGRSFLARRAKNHFGIKCGRAWNGEKVYREDDDYNDQGRLIKSCFREYRNPEASFVAHSEFLRDPNKAFRYGFLFRLDPTDYRAWAHGLRRAGYATNPRYPELLISLIERYNLSQYDAPGAVDPVVIEPVVEEVISGIRQVNDVSYFVSDRPLSVAEIARKVDLSVQRLLDYNEKLGSERSTVGSGDRVYFQKKRRSYRGRQVYHKVQAGETLYDISQRYGIRLKQLARRNKLSEDAQPAAGTEVKLRGSRVDDPPRLAGDEEYLPDTPPVPTTDDGRIDMDEPTDPDPVDRPTIRPPARPPYNVDRPETNPPANPPGPVYPPVTTPDPTPSTPPPGPVVRPPTVDPPGPTVSPTTQTYYTVVGGDTLYGISRRYGLSVDELKQLNGLTSNNLAVGQRLRVSR